MEWMTDILHGDADKRRLQCLLQENEKNSSQHQRLGFCFSVDKCSYNIKLHQNSFVFCGWRGGDTFDREATFTGKCLWEIQASRRGDKNTEKDEQKSWNSWNSGVQYEWWLYRTEAGSSHGQYWTTTACMKFSK